MTNVVAFMFLAITLGAVLALLPKFIIPEGNLTVSTPGEATGNFGAVQEDHMRP